MRRCTTRTSSWCPRSWSRGRAGCTVGRPDSRALRACSPHTPTRLAVGAGAVDILLGFRRHLLAADHQVDVPVDSAQCLQERRAALFLVDFEHKGAGEFRSVRDHRIIGSQFIGQLFVAAFLDAQHFLDLQPHAFPAFELDRGIGTDRDPPVFLAQDRFLPLVLADRFIILKRDDIIAGYFMGIAGHV